MAKITISIVNPVLDKDSQQTAQQEGNSSSDNSESVIDMIISGPTIQSGTCSFNVSYTDKSTKIGGTDKTGTGIVNFSMTVQRYAYCKQMYKPNEMTLQVQIAPKQESADYHRYAKVGQDKLKTAFCNKQVRVATEQKTADNETVETKDEDFYIHELTTVYKKDAMYVTMHLFSPDKLMTLKTEGMTYVGKRLSTDVLSRVASYYLPYNSKVALGKDASNMKTLMVAGEEHIFPYLVQYNESFYDFLARTANRWGEFLYWENNKLNIGYNIPQKEVETKDSNGKIKKTMVDDFTVVDSYDSYTFLDMSQSEDDVTDLNVEANYDDHFNNYVLQKGKYDEVRGQLGSSKGWDTYIFNKVSQLLSFDVNLYDWIVGTLVDDSVALAQAELRSSDKNKKFNEKYFSDTSTKSKQFNDDDSQFNEFSEFSSIADDTKYLSVLKGEVAAARNMLVIDLDTNWQNLRLGQAIEFRPNSTDESGDHYIIVKIEATQPNHYAIEDYKVKEITDVSETGITFRVTAIPYNSTDKRFYPTVIPAGHVRKSDMQIATVVDDDDPKRSNRIKIQFDWDKQNEKSPWLLFASPVSAKGAGFEGRHHKGDKVVVNFHYGNVERPYISGAVSSEMPTGFITNEVVCNTPGGQAIKMSDGTGAGATAMVTGLQPGLKFITGFFPATDWFTSNNDDGSKSDDDQDVKSRYFEGGIELCDKYGVWSIKGSTDSRNVSIKSAWGDVSINAFTGITISAPNGDVKIKGKNVSIEAGNNLTLTSGKNVKDKWYPTLMDYDSTAGFLLNLAGYLAVAVPKKLEQLAFGLLDLSILRNLFETFVKPVEGKLEICSNRYLMLEAGGATASYPVDAYNKDKRVYIDNDHQTMLSEFGKIQGTVDDLFQSFKLSYRLAKNAKQELATMIAENMLNVPDGDPIAPCKSLDQIIQAAWNDTVIDPAFMEFGGLLQPLNRDELVYDDIVKFFQPGYNPVDKNNDLMLEVYELNVVTRQGNRKLSLLYAAQALKVFVDALKDTEDLLAAAKNRKLADNKMKNALTTELMNNSPIVTLLNNDNFKMFNLEENNLFNDDDKKKLRRKFYVAAVNAYGIKQFEAVNKITGLPVAPPPAPDPYGADADEKWPIYVSSLYKVGGPEKDQPDVWDKVLEEAFVKPAKKFAKSYTDFGRSFSDHFAFGPAEKGSILFTSAPGTMVLGQEIYRANIDFAEDVNYSETVSTSGIVAQIRNLME